MRGLGFNRNVIYNDSTFYKVEDEVQELEDKTKQVVINMVKTELTSDNEGETIETRVMRIMEDKTPIADVAPIIYTEAKDGVNPMYDVRADKFDLALNELSGVHKSNAEAYAMSISKQLSEGAGQGQAGEGDASEA